MSVKWSASALCGCAVAAFVVCSTTARGAEWAQRPLAAAIATNEAVGEKKHPQDGPHVDLRFRVDAKEFVAEIAMNLVFLDWMVQTDREDAERVDASELPRVRAALAAYCAVQMPVRIDGAAVVGDVRALRVNDPDEALLPLFPVSGWRGLRKVSFEIAFALSAPPQSISVMWSAYPPDLLSVLASKPPLDIAAEWSADGLRSQLMFTRSEPGFTWNRPVEGVASRLERVPTPPSARAIVPSWATLAVLLFIVAFLAAAMSRKPPRIALGTGLLAAVIVMIIRPSGLPFLAFGSRSAAELDERDARATFEALQANLYRAFDYDSESMVYDALALSVSGELLEETYLGVRRALVIEEEGGAMSRVVALTPMSTVIASHGEIADATGKSVAAFVVNASWRVEGRVTHWGHAHDRTNEYEGRFVVAALADGWRIHDAEITRQERVESAELPQMPTVPVDPANEEL